MTDFSKVRIPATRSGSGTVRRVRPSGVVDVARAMGRTPVQRLRRHVDKGTTDLWPSIPPGQEVINDLTQWDGTSDSVFNMICVITNGSASLQGLCGPNKVGQLLFLCLEDQLNGSYEAVFDATACLNGIPPIVDGSTVYTQIELDNKGDNVLLVGLRRGGTLSWYVVDNNGGILT